MSAADNLARRSSGSQTSAPKLDPTNEAHLAAAREVLAAAGAGDLVPDINSFPRVKLTPIAVPLIALELTKDNIDQVRLALGLPAHPYDSEIFVTKRASDGYDHEWGVGDFMVWLPDGPHCIAREDRALWVIQ